MNRCLSFLWIKSCFNRSPNNSWEVILCVALLLTVIFTYQNKKIGNCKWESNGITCSLSALVNTVKKCKFCKWKMVLIEFRDKKNQRRDTFPILFPKRIDIWKNRSLSPALYWRYWMSVYLENEYNFTIKWTISYYVTFFTMELSIISFPNRVKYMLIVASISLRPLFNDVYPNGLFYLICFLMV